MPTTKQSWLRLPHSIRTVVMVSTIMTAIVLSPMLMIGFVTDDVSVISLTLTDNHIDLAKLFRPPSAAGIYFRPLVDMTLAIDYEIWGWNSFGFRLTNLLLHVLCTVLVAVFGYRLFRSVHVGFIAALLFGLMPIHEMSLFWIAGRTDVLCAAFYIASLIAFHQWWQSRRLSTMMFSLTMFVCAILSKEMALSLPMIVVLVAWWELTRTHNVSNDNRIDVEQGRSWLQTIRLFATPALPFVACAIGVLLVRWFVFGSDLIGGEQGLHSVNVSPISIAKNVAKYLGLLIVPTGHRAIETVLITYPFLYILFAAIAMVGAVVVIVRLRSRMLGLYWCALFVIITLVPVSRLSLRWYLYIPSIGFALGLGWLFSRLNASKTKIAIGSFVVLATLYTAILVSGAFDWVNVSKQVPTLIEQIRSTAPDHLSGNDTLLFLSVPSKIGTAPLFNLGFPTLLRHEFNQPNLTVLTFSSVEMDRYPTTISCDSVDRGTAYRLRCAPASSFAIADAELMTRKRNAESGMKRDIEGADVTIVSTDEHNKPIEIEVRPRWVSNCPIYTFDGQRLVRVR